MKAQSKLSPRMKIIIAILVIFLLFWLYFIYATCIGTTQRVFTRDNTALEKLPEGVDIPMMPDGLRVDYVRAYELIYPDFIAAREDNALRDVVRFMGPAMLLWETWRSNSTPQTMDEILASFNESPKMQASWRAYCEKLNLDPDALQPYAGLPRSMPPSDVVVQRKLRQWEAEFPQPKTEVAQEAEDAGENAENMPAGEEAAEAPLYTVPESAAEFPLPDDLLKKLAEEDGMEPQTVFENYYGERFSRPWTAAEFPEMAQWLEYHAPLMDVLATAARREVFILPVYRNDENTHLLMMLLPDVEIFRLQSRMFGVRARMHIPPPL